MLASRFYWVTYETTTHHLCQTLFKRVKMVWRKWINLVLLWTRAVFVILPVRTPVNCEPEIETHYSAWTKVCLLAVLFDIKIKPVSQNKLLSCDMYVLTALKKTGIFTHTPYCSEERLKCLCKQIVDLWISISNVVLGLASFEWRGEVGSLQENSMWFRNK